MSSVTAEQFAVGAAYLHQLPLASLEAPWFADETAALAWQHALERQKTQLPWDVTTLIAAHPETGVAVMDWMLAVHQLAPVAAEQAGFVEAVRDGAAMRAYDRVAQQLRQSAHGGTVDPDALTRALIQVRREFYGRDRQDSTLQAAATRYLNETLAVLDGVQPPIVRTGVASVDRILLGGMRATDVILIGARTSVGKSALALQIARHAAKIQRKAVLYVSLEMSEHDVLTRWLAADLGINSQVLRIGAWRDEALTRRVTTAIGALESWPLRLWDRGNLAWEEIAARVDALRDADECDLLIVDYVQLMRRPHTGTTADELEAIAGSLKESAKQWQIPVIAISQINREAEHGEDGRPKLWQLRGSGGLENSADAVLLLYRPKEGRIADGSGPMDIDVAKQRNGPVDVAHCWFNAPFQQIEDRPAKAMTA